MRCVIVLGILVGLALVGCGQQAPRSPSEQANLQLRKGLYDQAIESATGAISSEPSDGALYLIRGRAYHYRDAEGDLQRAIADLTKAIELAPENPEPLYSRALAYRDLGDEDNSSADDVKARSLDRGRIGEVANLEVSARSELGLEPPPDPALEIPKSSVETTMPQPVDFPDPYIPLPRREQPTRPSVAPAELPGGQRLPSRRNETRLEAEAPPRARTNSALAAPGPGASGPGIARDEPRGILPPPASNRPASPQPLTIDEMRRNLPPPGNPFGGPPVSNYPGQAPPSGGVSQGPFSAPNTRGPRPTGYVEDPLSVPAGGAPRTYYTPTPAAPVGKPFEF